MRSALASERDEEDDAGLLLSSMMVTSAMRSTVSMAGARWMFALR